MTRKFGSKPGFLLRTFLFQLSLGIAGICTSLDAQDYPITDRSPVYATSFITPTKSVMVEGGYFEVGGLGSLDDSNLNGFQFLVRYGIADHLELRISEGFSHLHPGPLIDLGSIDLIGFSSLQIGIKSQWIAETNVFPAVSFLMNLELPSIGNELFKPNHLSPSFRLIIEKFLNKTFIIGSNLGYQWRDAPEQSFTYSLSLRTSLGEKVSMYTEFYGSNAKSTAATNYFDVALEFWVWKNVILDLAYGSGLTDLADNDFLSLGGAIRFN